MGAGGRPTTGRVGHRADRASRIRCCSTPGPHGGSCRRWIWLRCAQSIAGKDAVRFLAVVTGCDVDDALQQVGAGVPMALQQRRDQAEPVALSVINRLTWRGGPGDQVLAEDLLACLRGEPLAGTAVPVDLDMLSMEMEGDVSLSSGGYVDLRTGEVYGDSATDPAMVGEDAAIDVEEDPDRWLRFDRIGPRDGWQDMADFAQRQREAGLRERLERAIHGAGAFRRFRDLVHDEGLTDQWYRLRRRPPTGTCPRVPRRSWHPRRLTAARDAPPVRHLFEQDAVCRRQRITGSKATRLEELRIPVRGARQARDGGPRRHRSVAPNLITQGDGPAKRGAVQLRHVSSAEPAAETDLGQVDPWCPRTSLGPLTHLDLHQQRRSPLGRDQSEPGRDRGLLEDPVLDVVAADPREQPYYS